MKKHNIITSVIVLIITAVILILRYPYRNAGKLESTEIAVSGITNYIALECGNVIEGIFVTVPDHLEPDEIISVSSDPNIAHLILDRENIGDDRIMNARISALNPGVVELYVKSADGEMVSVSYTLNIVASENPMTDSHSNTENPQTELSEGSVVYVTPSGTKYHLRRSCAGKNGSPTTFEEAIDDGYEPCKSCAVYK